MTSTTSKIISGLVILGIIIFIIVISYGKLFVPEDKILKPKNFELPKESDLISCQLDCTLNDGVFHEKCIGYNGCEDNNFLRDSGYCEEDSDCVLDLGCCIDLCQGDECLNQKYCRSSNEKYVKAHEFSCQYGIKCESHSTCLEYKNAKCLFNRCRITN